MPWWNHFLQNEILVLLPALGDRNSLAGVYHSINEAGERQPWLCTDKAESCTLISFSSDIIKQCWCMSSFPCCSCTSLGCDAKLKSKANKCKFTRFFGRLACSYHILPFHHVNVALQTSLLLILQNQIREHHGSPYPFHWQVMPNSVYKWAIAAWP